MLTKKGKYKKNNRYDWTKEENCIKVRFKLWVSYKHASVGKYGLTIKDNTRVYNGYYEFKDFGLSRLYSLIEEQKEDIFNARIIETRTNEPVYIYIGFVKHYRDGSIEALGIGNK